MPVSEGSGNGLPFASITWIRFNGSVPNPFGTLSAFARTSRDRSAPLCQSNHSPMDPRGQALGNTPVRLGAIKSGCGER